MAGPKPSPEEIDRFSYGEGDLIVEHVGTEPAPTGEEVPEIEQERGEPPTIHIYE